MKDSIKTDSLITEEKIFTIVKHSSLQQEGSNYTRFFWIGPFLKSHLLNLIRKPDCTGAIINVFIIMQRSSLEQTPKTFVFLFLIFF